MDRAEPALGRQSKIERIPSGVLFNIFSRLPLKSVIWARCVSKSWFNITTDPAFMKLHTSRSKSDPALLILKRATIGDNNIISIRPLKHENIQLHANETAIGHMVSSSSWDFVGTCEGLLCFTSSSKEEIIICNPITGENINLPEPGIAPSLDSCVPMLAFGFDPVENKYKVIRLFYYNKFGYGGRFGQDTASIKAEVYTLGGPNFWREVEGFDYYPDGKPVYACGALHWLVHPKQYIVDKKKIVLFDLGREKFERIAHPKFGHNISLVELGGCLSVVDLSSGNLVEIYVLKDTDIWELDYIIPIQKPSLVRSEYSRLICVHECNGVLIIWLEDCLLSYERGSMPPTKRMMKIVDFPIWSDWEICSGFRSSLVPLRDSDDAFGEREGKDVRFVSDVGLLSLEAKGGGFGQQEESERCRKIVACFIRNCMLAPN